MRLKTGAVLLALLAFAGVLTTRAQTETTRTIRGQVLGLDAKPVTGALVHLKNRKTGAVLTVVSDKEGRYLFAGVPLRIDLELSAEFQKLRSRSKKFSRLDRRTNIILNFDLKKPEKKTPKPREKEAKPTS